MTITEAGKRLTALGFTMNPPGADSLQYGTKAPEPFDYKPHHVLGKPVRDVFIGTAAGGFYITSYVRFTARRFAARNRHQAEILNIFGSGATLDQAVNEFEKNFLARQYNGSDAYAVRTETVHVNIKCAVDVPAGSYVNSNTVTDFGLDGKLHITVDGREIKYVVGSTAVSLGRTPPED